jgi:threonine dehydrogenase-like Zn-dependent dehydrogenase
MRRLVMTALRTLEMQEGERPRPPAGWVRLEMLASALGLTQLQLLSGSTSTGGLPRVLGHEMVGRVVELGDGVRAPAIGSLVVVDCLFGCGRCARCIEGSEVVCADFRMIGYTIDGGYAEEVVVPAANAFELPSGTPPAEAVLLASALPSSVRIVRRAGVAPGDRVIVIGAGSIGDLSAQVAVAHGATVVVADTDEARLREVAPHASATVLLHSGEPVAEAAARLRAAADVERGADVVIEAAGERAALELSMAVTRPGGTLLAGGLPSGALAFEGKTVREAVVQEITVRGSFAFSRTDFPRVIELYRSSRIDLSTVISEPVRLEDVPATVDGMWTGGTRGRRHPVLIAKGASA